PLATNDKSFLIILVPEKSQMSIFFYCKIKKLIHCPEKHVTGLYQRKTLNSAKQPVVKVYWEDARAYAAWLAQRSGKKIRLPTEAEWEYAARAGTNTARFWGDVSDNACLYANVYDTTSQKTMIYSNRMHHNCDDGYAVTAPVGSFQANSFGLHDMLGNVWEWCTDKYGRKYYATSPKKNPIGPHYGPFRVSRGGSWSSAPRLARCSIREWDFPDNRGYIVIGFRLLISSVDFYEHQRIQQ
ncbi:MAG: hypothetical protein D3921_13480, partial [Candidatus Electrothrix sp. AW1]|nr:hypothetical protein [Candidatus Electrothrix gigas]